MHLDSLRFSYHGSATLYCKRIAELPFQNKFVPDNFVRWQKHPRARAAEFLSIHATLGIPSPRARTTNKTRVIIRCNDPKRFCSFRQAGVKRLVGIATEQATRDLAPTLARNWWSLGSRGRLVCLVAEKIDRHSKELLKPLRSWLTGDLVFSCRKIEDIYIYDSAIYHLFYDHLLKK
jgi:hypothetical protein